MDQGVHAYLYALREYADEETLEKIDEALEPPATFRVGGRPGWYESDEDAWAEWSIQAR